MKRALPAAAGLIVIVAAVFAGLSGQPCRGEQQMSHKTTALPSPAEIARLPPDGGPAFNRLIHEKSPYLLQHARNPVDWYPWGQEAFARAKEENKPIFLSVGYSTCHWCHVMERESFEHADVAAILNAHYVAIKVDREERPDIDGIYMLATQMLIGRGGWPNSLWLTPGGKPWYAGSYFPREDRSGRPGFKSILTSLAKTWKERRKDVDARAESISQTLRQYSAAKQAATPGELSRELVSGAVSAMERSFDERNGGFGGAPKFPPHSSLRLLAAEYRRTKNASLLKLITETLDAMARGGIRDHVGGGFHRYSTDARWLLPHFEKMLYDNAQLARAYVDGYLLTGERRYRQVAEDIYGWVIREMTDEGGGFRSAMDADSEGEEGRFYLWRRGEIIDALGERDGPLFCGVYGVVEEGNFRDEAIGRLTGVNILYLPKSLEAAARRRQIAPDELRRRLAGARRKLLALRVKREWPYLDDKVLTSWNGLMIGSLAYGGRHLDEPRYIAAARGAADFILTRMRKKGRLLRTYRQGQAKLNAYLDDYAFLTSALLDLHQATGAERWLAEAASLADDMIKHHWDEDGGGFYFTAGDHEELLARTKNPFDSAIPAGNAVAARSLIRLAELTGRRRYLRVAKETLTAFQGSMRQSPRGTAGLILAASAYLDVPQAAAGAPGPQPDAVSQSPRVEIGVFASALTAPPGGTIDLAVRIAIDAGWHVNSHTPLSKDLIPTDLTLDDSAPASLGEVVYPPGKRVKFAFSDEALSLYEGEVWLRAEVLIPQTAEAGPLTLPLAVSTQVCNDRSCLAPRTHALTLRITVDPAATTSPPRHPFLLKRLSR